jgi:RPA family protein
MTKLFQKPGQKVNRTNVVCTLSEEFLSEAYETKLELVDPVTLFE